MKPLTCVKCGQAKPLTDFSPDPKRRTEGGYKKRRPYCKECDRARAREYWQRTTCPRCQKHKPLRTGFYQWTDHRYPGKVRRSRYCRDCTRERNRERYAAIMADPYTAELERKRKRNEPDRRGPKNVERCRRYRERLRNERPDDYRRLLEDARINAKLRHMRNGGAPKKATKNWVGKGTTVWLDPEPIKRVCARIHVVDDIDPVLARAIYRLLNETNSRVELSTVDAIAVFAGISPYDLYPELAA